MKIYEMKIGKLVRSYIPNILDYCEKRDPSEFDRLMDLAYSKEVFGVHYPFLKDVNDISEKEKIRYWREQYAFRNSLIRVTNDWIEEPRSKSRTLFNQYILDRRISSDLHISSEKNVQLTDQTRKKRVLPPAKTKNSRYRGNAIGNSQNLLIRNILSNLGEENITSDDWEKTKEHFSHACAYCGQQGELVMDHAVPINRQSLGEHRLGNLVPCCKSCNQEKGDKNFREYLSDKQDRLEFIIQYMNSRNYQPLGDNEKIRMILQEAHKEVSIVSERYRRMLNSLFFKTE